MRDRKQLLIERMDELKKLILHAANELNDKEIVKKYCSTESGIEIAVIIESYVDQMKDIEMELDNE